MDNLDEGLTDQIVEVYFSSGVPNGMNPSPTAVFTPKIVELSTNEGSQAGSKIYANVQGVGINDSVTLVDRTNTSPANRDLCQTATVLRYGVVECNTKAEVIPTDIEVGVKNIDNSQSYSYDGAQVTDVYFKTFADLVQPKITGPATFFPLQNNMGGFFAQQGFTAFPNCIGYYFGVESNMCGEINPVFSEY